MRYIVQDQQLPANHNVYPDRVVYYLLDLVTRRLSLGYSLSYDLAKAKADKKNGRKV